jgi:hypothetical protein
MRVYDEGDGSAVIQRGSSESIRVEAEIMEFKPRKLHCDCGRPVQAWDLRHPVSGDIEITCDACHTTLATFVTRVSEAD